MLLLLWLLLLRRTISKSKYIRPSPAFRPFHTAKLCIVGLPVVVLCMLIFKPFCTCSITCDESQMNKASAVLFFFLLSCVALLKKNTHQTNQMNHTVHLQPAYNQKRAADLTRPVKMNKSSMRFGGFQTCRHVIRMITRRETVYQNTFFFFNHKLKHHKLHIIKVSYTHTHTTDCFF